jgi:predicted metal-dependent hydrolase
MVSPSSDIIRRRIDIDFSLEDKHRWTIESAYFEDMLNFEDILNVVSYFFPIGEKYFITSVQNYEDQITDPVLKQNVKDFIYQEAMHTKQHVRSNVVLDSIHSYGPTIEKISDFFLVKTRWLTPKATQLAITCALEHFTALLADYLLRTLEDFNSQSNESFGPLWAWHAVEETEHKSVCFDVYQNIFGNGVISYLHRVFVMMIVSPCFLTAVFVGLFMIRKGQRQARKTQAAGKQLSSEEQVQPKVKKPYRQVWGLIRRSMNPELYFAYYRPSFHPWNHDNSHLIDDWKEAYPEFGTSPSSVNGETPVSSTTGHS